MRRLGLAVSFSVLLTLPTSLLAATFELRDLYRDTRMKAMGGAGIASEIEDRDAIQGIFTNPAQMAGNSDFTFHYLTGDLGASWDTYTSINAGRTALSNFTFSNLNALIGKNIYANGQYVAAVTAPHFGAAILLDAQAGFYAQNPSYPEYTVAVQSTNGVQAAWGTTIDFSGPRQRRPRKGKSARAAASVGNEMRVGLGGKVMWRKGGFKEVPLSTLVSADQDFLNQLMGNYEIGYGVDAGTQFISTVSEGFSWSLGASYINLGDMNFRRSNADTQRGNLTAGVGAKLQLRGLTSLSFAYDHANLNQAVDWRKRQHFGVNWELPGISVFGGIHQTYLSYGASFDAWLIRVTAASYAEELGGSAYEMGDRRYVVRLAMRFAL
ncbi:MAG: hypothetical protein KGQ59_04970 [Bdellovibrionales bacterium]|nr:hypothetical protein [Bdellovibrionales bacterium]